MIARYILSHLTYPTKKKNTPGFFFSTTSSPIYHPPTKNFHTTTPTNRNEPFVQAVVRSRRNPSFFPKERWASLQPSWPFRTIPPLQSSLPTSTPFRTSVVVWEERTVWSEPVVGSFGKFPVDPNPKTGIRHDFRKAKGSQKTVGCFRVI